MTSLSRGTALAGGFIAAVWVALALAGPAGASAPSPTAPAAVPSARGSLATVPGSPTAAPRVPIAVPTNLPTLAPGGGAIQVPAGNANSAPGTPVWEIAGLSGAGLALLGGGVAVVRRR